MQENRPEAEANRLIEKIDDLSRKMGFEDHGKTVFEMSSTDDPEIKELIHKSGEWSENKPMFIYDKEDPHHAYVFISAERFANLLNTLQATNQENFDLKLEKSILKQTPVDFHDVWVVAMDRIQKIIQEQKEKGEPHTINLDQLISDIKREYPALFINLSEVLNDTGQYVLPSSRT
ncbi:hypothetical protein YH65_03730 [Sulfurovum lithotrophicum]|uniref:UPF0763 protein YH65_03730 n=1 Tax=Sulfurovum lithotrophicum TaxID=206403 RepID=A0A7U4RQ78_9BACT|nr:DUF2603 domain-containing protein [Sulfurovum lithotrophicum]AKF24598.1 hypothetical protein YH65_03730 [Sulfurovum lithotrophicum]